MDKLILKNVTLLGIECRDEKIPYFQKAAEICQSYCEFGDVVLLTSNNIGPINNIGDYTKFMIMNLNNWFSTEYVLIFQTDGFILNPNAWQPEFFEYDYIGATWGYRDNLDSFCGLKSDQSGNVGNGGFSLRSKKLCSLVQQEIEVFQRNGEWYSTAHTISPAREQIEFNRILVRCDVPEDHIICRTNGAFLEHRGIKFAPDNLADRFSVEAASPVYSKDHIYRLEDMGKWNGSFGFHSSFTNLCNWEDKEKFGIEKDTLYEEFEIGFGSYPTIKMI